MKIVQLYSLLSASYKQFSDRIKMVDSVSEFCHYLSTAIWHREAGIFVKNISEMQQFSKEEKTKLFYGQ
jgi:hypothetical protein